MAAREGSGFWERPEVVARFAERDPDHRLAALVNALELPERHRVLDLGCAGGRNTVFLAERGFDVRAVDASGPMVEETRRRLAAVVGPEEARRRVRQGRMDDLAGFPDASFDLVVALGVYQNAQSLAEWQRAVAETARVLRPGGRVLVAQFTPDVDLTGEGTAGVAGEPHVFTGMPGGGRSVLFYATGLEEAMAAHGLVPAADSETVVVETDIGRRSTVNALLEKRGSPSQERTP